MNKPFNDPGGVSREASERARAIQPADTIVPGGLLHAAAITYLVLDLPPRVERAVGGRGLDHRLELADMEEQRAGGLAGPRHHRTKRFAAVWAQLAHRANRGPERTLGGCDHRYMLHDNHLSFRSPRKSSPGSRREIRQSADDHRVAGLRLQGFISDLITDVRVKGSPRHGHVVLFGRHHGKSLLIHCPPTLWLDVATIAIGTAADFALILLPTRVGYPPTAGCPASSRASRRLILRSVQPAPIAGDEGLQVDSLVR